MMAIFPSSWRAPAASVSWFSRCSLSIEPLDAALLDALTRLVRLLDEPTLASRLAPLIRQEITVRLLAGPHGAHLRHLVSAGSPGHQIAKAVAWLKQHFMHAMDVDELASRSHMNMRDCSANPRSAISSGCVSTRGPVLLNLNTNFSRCISAEPSFRIIHTATTTEIEFWSFTPSRQRTNSGGTRSASQKDALAR